MTDDRPPMSSLAKHFLTQARAELARVQQSTCGHGVPRTATCTECDETSQSSTDSQSNDSQSNDSQSNDSQEEA